MNRPILFDVDGVLADFVIAYLTLLRDCVPGCEDIEPYHTGLQKVWDFSIDKNYIHAGWVIVKNSNTFWMTLPPLVSPGTFARINALTKKREVYFVTSRSGGHKAQEQTRRWLTEHGVEHPTVIVSKNKGQFARAVDAAALIDDKAGNAVYVAYESPSTTAYLLNRQYNRFDHSVLGSKVRRIRAVDEFLDEIEKEGI